MFADGLHSAALLPTCEKSVPAIQDALRTLYSLMHMPTGWTEEQQRRRRLLEAQLGRGFAVSFRALYVADAWRQARVSTETAPRFLFRPGNLHSSFRSPLLQRDFGVVIQLVK